MTQADDSSRATAPVTIDPKRHRRAAETLRGDPALAELVDQHGVLSLEPADDTFGRLVTAVIRQQVSMDAADAIRARLFDAIEVTPEGVLSADDTDLRDAGLSEAKVEYVRNVAQEFAHGDWDLAYLASLEDHTVMEELTAIRGIGPWTAKMFLLFGLGRPDVFPVEDLGIRRGMELVCRAGQTDETVGEDGTAGSDCSTAEMTRAEMRARAEAWAPFRSYAALYLWRAYEG